MGVPHNLSGHHSVQESVVLSQFSLRDRFPDRGVALVVIEQIDQRFVSRPRKDLTVRIGEQPENRLQTVYRRVVGYCFPPPPIFTID